MRSPINDEEDLLRSIQAFVKENLNANIIAINTEKDTPWHITQIEADDDHFVFAGELLDLPNHTFVSFSIDGTIETEIVQDDMSSILPIVVEIVFDNPKKENTYFKSLRYMRALYETLLKYEPSTDEVAGFQINKVAPMTINSINRQLVISGVTISAAIG